MLSWFRRLIVTCSVEVEPALSLFLSNFTTRYNTNKLLHDVRDMTQSTLSSRTLSPRLPSKSSCHFCVAIFLLVVCSNFADGWRHGLSISLSVLLNWFSWVFLHLTNFYVHEYHQKPKLIFFGLRLLSISILRRMFSVTSITYFPKTSYWHSFWHELNDLFISDTYVPLRSFVGPITITNQCLIPYIRFVDFFTDALPSSSCILTKPSTRANCLPLSVWFQIIWKRKFAFHPSFLPSHTLCPRGAACDDIQIDLCTASGISKPSPPTFFRNRLMKMRLIIFLER